MSRKNMKGGKNEKNQKFQKYFQKSGIFYEIVEYNIIHHSSKGKKKV